ncbi:MAG: tetratricopeptide repeat protein [Neisseriaceae bacterium]|nr:tetratricopeptide repeat protein [Neisseriaceae bacterium]
MKLSNIRMRTYLSYLYFSITILCIFISSNLIHANDEQEIRNKASYLFMALSSEILLTKGYGAVALDAYYKLLQQTQDVKIAERATEIALANRDLAMSKQIQSLWNSYHKKPSNHLKNLAWEQAVLEKNYSYLFNNLERVLSSTTPQEQNFVFNTMISLILQDMSLSRYAKQINTITKRYPDNIDAIITNVIYSAASQNYSSTQKAITQLHSISPKPNERIVVLLRFLNDVNPTYLNDFFKNLPPEKYQKEWISFYIDQFLNQKQYEQASDIIQKALVNFPSKPLYTQAGYISALKNEPQNVYNHYFTQAYQLADKEQKNYVAAFAAAGALANKSLDLCQLWLNKIQSPDYEYDKLIMQGFIAYDQGDYKRLKKILTQAEKLPQLSGVVYQYDQYARLKLAQIAQTEKGKNALKEAIVLENSVQGNAPELTDIKMRILLYKGDLYADDKNYTQAEQAYREAVSIYPDAFNLNALGYTLLEFNDQKKNKQALTILQQAYELDTSSPEIMDSLGWAYVLNGYVNKGLPYLRRAYQAIQSSEAGSHLAHALWISGDKESALQIIRTELNKNPSDPFMQKVIKINRISKKER